METELQTSFISLTPPTPVTPGEFGLWWALLPPQTVQPEEQVFLRRRREKGRKARHKKALGWLVLLAINAN